MAEIDIMTPVSVAQAQLRVQMFVASAMITAHKPQTIWKTAQLKVATGALTSTIVLQGRPSTTMVSAALVQLWLLMAAALAMTTAHRHQTTKKIAQQLEEIGALNSTTALKDKFTLLMELYARVYVVQASKWIAKAIAVMETSWHHYGIRMDAAQPGTIVAKGVYINVT